ncbi:MAG: hypothetical protein PHS57_07425 [Alphaproteobacteria bacterium]|nr:hypothetical protein [Alphaproteobacteria bacterium]
MTRYLVVLALVLGMGGCSAWDLPSIPDLEDHGAIPTKIPGREDVVRGDKDPAIVTLKLKSGLREKRLIVSENLPNDVIVPTTNLNGVPITAALQAVLSGTDIALSWDSGAMGSRLVTVMNLRGPLSRVVEKICSAAKVFCTYRHGSIELSEKEIFVVSLPPIARAVSAGSISSSSSAPSSSVPQAAAGVSNTIVDAINKLLDGETATVDEQGGNIVYTATVDAEERVARYLKELRTERPLIVMQMYIWEVMLDQANAQGIKWDSFQNTAMKNATLSLSNSLTSLESTAGSISLGAVTTGNFSADVVASFVATKGRIKTISNPQITFVSGSTGSLKVGGTQKYISEVGTSSSSDVSGSSSSSSTNTVTTDTIDTGLSVSISGAYENGVVFASLDLSIKSLVSLNPTQSGSGTIDLPETTDEMMNTILRVRPGDSVILAGLVSSSESGSSQGFPLGTETALPLYGKDLRESRELVLILKPSVILFEEDDASDHGSKGSHSSPAEPSTKSTVHALHNSEDKKPPASRIQPAMVSETTTRTENVSRENKSTVKKKDSVAAPVSLEEEDARMISVSPDEVEKGEKSISDSTLGAKNGPHSVTEAKSESMPSKSAEEGGSWGFVHAFDSLIHPSKKSEVPAVKDTTKAIPSPSVEKTSVEKKSGASGDSFDFSHAFDTLLGPAQEAGPPKGVQ